MSFSEPLALLGLIFVPLIVAFYMWRAQHQRQVVSSTWLWAEALARFSHRPTRRFPLRDPLLLLQLIAVAALTLLFSGPRLSRAAHVHQIVVLDGSVAMAASDVSQTRFTQATRRVEQMIAGLGPEDSLSLILAGPHARLVGGIPGNIDLAAAVDRLGPPAGTADLAGAVTLARGAAASPGAGVPRITFVAAPETPALAIGTLPVNDDRVGVKPLDDQSIGALTARCRPDGTSCEAFARVLNAAGSPRSVQLSAWADSLPLGSQTLRVPARGSLDLTFALPKGTGSAHVALLGRDALATDNDAWALVPTPTRLQALFVSDSPGQMLQGLRDVPGMSVRLMATDQFPNANLMGVDLLILDKVSPDNIQPMPMLVIDPPQSNTLVNVRASNVFLPADRIDVSDPLVQGLDLYGLSTNGEAVDTPSWAHVVVGGKNGALLMDGVQNGARAAILAFDAGHSSFAQDLAFPLLVTRLVHWLLPMPPASVAAGSSVWLPTDVQAVRDPSGVVLTGPMVNASAQGVYTVSAASGARLAGDPLFAVSTASPSEASPSADVAPTWAPPLSAAGTLAQNLWPIVLILALLAISGEWWFYARKT